MKGLATGLMVMAMSVSLATADAAVSLQAEGQESRIDLAWSIDRGAPEAGDAGTLFHVEQAATPNGPWTRLTAKPVRLPLFSDFVGRNDETRSYRVVQVDARGQQIAQSNTASATSRAMDDEALIESIQKATFRYFWDYAHPKSGLIREDSIYPDRCTTGGTGFGLMAYVVGAERGFVTREQAAQRTQQVVRFLDERVSRYHGAFPHWVDGGTGETLPFSTFDDGADLVETALLMQGMLTVRQYFTGDNDTERDIRERITRLWEGVEWTFFVGDQPRDSRLLWHWSPNHGFKMNLRMGGEFHEGMLVYMLALASPTHGLPTEAYETGWVHDEQTYREAKSYHGITQPVGESWGGPLFLTQYPFLGFDPRQLTDRFTNYFESNRAITLINLRHCIANARKFKGYNAQCWGLTASMGPDGYHIGSPTNDNGTIAPTAALAAMPYTPDESKAAMRYFYHELGSKLWGPMGFYDAFNLERDWYAKHYLAIDQGPILIMAENYRSGLLWELFMSNAEVEQVRVAMKESADLAGSRIATETTVDPDAPAKQ